MWHQVQVTQRSPSVGGLCVWRLRVAAAGSCGGQSGNGWSCTAWWPASQATILPAMAAEATLASLGSTSVLLQGDQCAASRVAMPSLSMPCLLAAVLAGHGANASFLRRASIPQRMHGIWSVAMCCLVRGAHGLQLSAHGARSEGDVGHTSLPLGLAKQSYL